MPAPWALLKETILNLESIEEVEYREASAQTATLLLKTSPGLVFQLELSPLQAVSIQAAVRAQSTFVWDQVNVVEITLPSAVAYPRQYEPREVTFSEQLAKWKK